jgi:light-regulated signal transduction histidine kinase (bacteriophytochrome)
MGWSIPLASQQGSRYEGYRRNIAIFSEMLLRAYPERVDVNTERFKGYIVEGVGRMEMLLSDLLAYTQVGSADDPVAPVDANAVVAAALKNLNTNIRDTRAVVTQDPLPQILGHDVHYIQLFQNLISNAIKYRGPREPRIHIGVEERRGEWLFCVQDNGIGIEPEYWNRIFGVFKRLHGREIPGTGIGLAICTKVVERYGGKIWVESKSGEGTRFYFTLPKAAGARHES